MHQSESVQDPARAINSVFVYLTASHIIFLPGMAAINHSLM